MATRAGRAEPAGAKRVPGAERGQRDDEGGEIDDVAGRRASASVGSVSRRCSRPAAPAGASTRPAVPVAAVEAAQQAAGHPAASAGRPDRGRRRAEHERDGRR